MCVHTCTGMLTLGRAFIFTYLRIFLCARILCVNRATPPKVMTYLHIYTFIPTNK